MRILKSFPVNDKKTELISKVFDRVIVSFEYPWNFDLMELHVRDEDKVLIEEGRCIIVLNYNDDFVKEMDSRGIYIMILRSLFKASLVLQEMPKLIGDIICNRDMTRRGFGDEIMYFYFQKNLERKARTLLEHLEKDVGWLSFCGIDDYNMQLLMKNMDKSPRLHKIRECLRHDLDGERLKHAIRLYEELVEECRL